MDALLRRATLHVADVGPQRDEEALPRVLGVKRREHAGVRDVAQRRAVRRALVVVLDVARRAVRRPVVAEELEQPADLLGREEEEQQHGVGLLGELVAVRVVALGAQDPVEALNVAVALAVAVPVELLELLIALELADDAVAVKRDVHLAAHLAPLRDLLVAEADLRAQRVAPAAGQQSQYRLRLVADPGDHDVRVGVVAQPALRGAGVLFVKLVGTHDAVDLVAVALGVVVRDRAPEARDLEHHLGAVVAQEVEVVGRLVVVPDVVEDRRVDVALAV